MKKITAIILSIIFTAFSLTSCFGRNKDKNNGQGEISAFYYTFSDTYISGVRSEMRRILGEASLSFNDYDANGSQTTQTEQVQTSERP